MVTRSQMDSFKVSAATGAAAAAAAATAATTAATAATAATYYFKSEILLHVRKN